MFNVLFVSLFCVVYCVGVVFKNLFFSIFLHTICVDVQYEKIVFFDNSCILYKKGVSKLRFDTPLFIFFYCCSGMMSL